MSKLCEELCICRTCLNSVEEENSYYLNDYAKVLNFGEVQIKNMMEKCVPEMDLEICDYPTICKACYELLVSTYVFKSRCFQTEEKIYLYIEENNLKLGDKIDLKTLANKDGADVCENSKPVLINNIVEENSSLELTIKEELETNNADEIKISMNSIDEEVDSSDGFKIPKTPYAKRQYSCDKCEYKGCSRDLLKQHLLSKCKSRVSSITFKCDSCSYTTVRKRNLVRHKLTHGGKRPYVCGVCGKGFTERHHLKNHMYHHSGDTLPFKCGEGDCKATFARKCDLNAHIIRHVNYKPLLCNICSKGFLRKEQWNEHMKDIHRIDFD